MRRILLLSYVLLLGSCLSEDSVDPGSSTTFVRYFNGGNNDEARSLLLAPDGGYIILATTRIQKQETDIPAERVKVIKTDDAGNPVWQKLYPDISDITNKTCTYCPSFRAEGIQNLPGGGYVIVADEGRNDSTTVAMMTIDENGELTASGNPSTDLFLRAKAINVNQAGNYYVLFVRNQAEMYVAEVDKSTFLPVTPAPLLYQAGATELNGRLLLNSAGEILWSGTVTKNTSPVTTGIRLIYTLPNSLNTYFDLIVSPPDFIERGFDFCSFGNEFAIIGSTNKKPDGTIGDFDILFKRVSSGGLVLASTSFPFDNPNTPEVELSDGQNDEGRSISSTNDGGLILLSSVGSLAINGRGDLDYYLIKINAFGGTTWTSSFGSRFRDEAIAVRQAPDGGYLVLGTTTQGALKIISLLKTDKDGKIE